MKCLKSKSSGTTNFTPEEIERYCDKIVDTLSLEETFQYYLEQKPEDDVNSSLYWGIIALDIINERVNLKAIKADMLSLFNREMSEEVVKKLIFFTIICDIFKFELMNIEKQLKVIEKIDQISPTYFDEASILIQEMQKFISST